MASLFLALSDEMVPILMVAIPVGLFIFVIVGAGIAKAAAEKEKRNRIWAKYGHTALAGRILERTIWQGETQEQLRDSLGSPADTDEKVLKTKSRVIWKYHHRGGNRYGLRITVENGMVTGWDEKM